MTVSQFIEENNVTITSERLRLRTDGLMSESMGAQHYRCALTYPGAPGPLVTEYTQGSAHTFSPKVHDVLGCLVDEAAGTINARDFDDWCSEYGYDTDSRKAEKIYRACLATLADLVRFAGPLPVDILALERDD